MSLPKRTLGKNGPEVSTLGFGLMVGLLSSPTLSYYGPAMEDKDAFALLDRTIELGCTFWDTSDVYGGSEDTLGRYFKARPGRRENIFLATKFGITYENGNFGSRGDHEYVIAAANKSLERLGVDYIDLFYVHRLDSKVPIEVTMKALVQLKNKGKIRHIGLSEASSDTLRPAHQVEYSPFELTIEHNTLAILKTTRELGIAIVAYSPLGRGLLTGKFRSPDDFAADDFRRTIPRFAPVNFYKNLEVVDKFAEIAKARNATPGQLALAWLLAQGPDIIPIPGTTRHANLEENIGAVAITLNASELAELNGVVRDADVAGERYGSDMLSLTFGDTPAV
ncbi:putative aldo-keto reductase [Auriculariales sp. MPI-PUGE-AT-0066]|nr:putative aldo-keto reductase [Auriculariales sp. MPI-PUGE-AT-0066]